MDANGTKFHLLKGFDDWLQCRETPDFEAETAPGWKAAEWDERRQSVRLRSRLTLFRTPKSKPMPLALRRGADRDAYGSTFWISDDGQEIFWIPSGESAPLRFWSQDATDECSTETFQPLPKPKPKPFRLAGLAINAAHFLIVGYYSATPTDEKGLLIFDLHKGGTPTRQIFPENFLFEPFEMSADSEGNVWILDRKNRLYWGLDRNFHLMGLDSGAIIPIEDRGAFVPSDGSPVEKSVIAPSLATLKGFSIRETSVVSIEAVGHGIVLVLDSPGLPDVSANPMISTVSRYRYGIRLGNPIELKAEIETVIEGTNITQETFDVVGYDFGFTSDATGSYLAVVEQDGKQAILFRVSGDASDPAATSGAPRKQLS